MRPAPQTPRHAVSVVPARPRPGTPARWRRVTGRWPAALGLALSATLGALASGPALAQAPQPAVAEAGRLRVGLALSGGGARGAAHVGVLKVLDAMRVPVDCIAGTSMGAVVGGAFAAGNTPEAMEKLIAETDWSDVFNDRPPRGEIAARRKLDDYKPLFAPEFGFSKGSLALPRGAVAGVTIEGFLRTLAAPADLVHDFHSLPIPYRAVAADIASGEAVVLSGGSLMQAMRASMAVPGAVAPVEIGGRLLVDGGIADNLPIDLVRGLCAADVVIAVNVSTPPMARGEITSALSVVGQLVNLLGKEAVDRQLASLRPGDVLITPDLAGISAADFERQMAAVAAGETSARAVAHLLGRLALAPEAYAQWRLTRIRNVPEMASVDEIRFEGIERTNQDVLMQLLATRVGEPLSQARLNLDLRRVYGRGDFDTVDYRIDDSTGRRALLIPVREKATGPDYLRFGLGFATDLRGETGFNALMSYRRTWLNALGGEWLSEAQAGQNSYLFTEFLQPLVRSGRVFVAPYAQWGQGLRGLFVDGDRLADYQIREVRAGVDVGGPVGTWGEWRLGPLTRRVKAHRVTGSPVLPDVSVRATGARLKLVGDSFDSPWFPREGQRLAASLYVSGDNTDVTDRYRRAEFAWSGAASAGAHTLAATVAAGSGIGTRLPIHEGFTLGGPLRLSAFRSGEFSGERVAFGSLRAYRRLYRLPSILGSGVYTGVSAEVGRVERAYASAPAGHLWSASLFLAAETFLGPGFAGVGFGPDGRRTFYLMVGVPGW